MDRLLFLDNLGGGEILVVAIFVLLFFGSDKIPGLMKSLGRAMREFRTAMDDVKNDIEQSVSEPAKKIKENIELTINEPVNSISRNINKAMELPDEKDNSDVETSTGNSIDNSPSADPEKLK